jgi:hypothetical protein
MILFWSQIPGLDPTVKLGQIKKLPTRDCFKTSRGVTIVDFTTLIN